MRQNPAAPVLAGGGVIAGTAALVVGLFSISDCVRFQSRPGECNEVVQEHAMNIVLGVLAVAGTAGGFFTVNPMLDRAKKRAEVEVTRAEPFVIPAAQPVGPQWGGDDEVAERVQFMAARGLSTEQIAEATGIEPAGVRTILASSADLEPGL